MRRLTLVRTKIAPPSILPWGLTLALTYRCNLRCTMCRSWEKPCQKELSLTEIEKLFSSLRHLFWVNITGGEPTLRDDLREIITAIFAHSCRMKLLHITTNGQRPEAIEHVARSATRRNSRLLVNVSIDGPEPLHDRLRGRQGAFMRCIESINRLKHLSGIMPLISCTITQENIEHIGELMVSLRKRVHHFSERDIHFNIFHVSSHFYANNSQRHLIPTDSGRLVGLMGKNQHHGILHRWLARAYVRGLRYYMRGEKPLFPCAALCATCFIDPGGTIFPCIHYDAALGNLSEYGFNLQRILRSEQAHRIRNSIRTFKCPGCWTPCEAYPSIIKRALDRIPFSRLRTEI